MITIPDSGTLQENKHVSLPLPSTLSPAATITTIVPGLKSSSLLSLGQLCDYGCSLFINKQNMYAIKDKEVVIEADRNHRYGLWDIIAPSYPNEKTSVQAKN